jgi:S-adenosylmethionine/arginine decarboxylase-like enzyme
MMGADFTGDVFLLASGLTKDSELLTNEAHLRAVLSRMPGLIGMNFLRDPLITIANNNPGLEGYVPIDMSNITISTYTENPRVLVCVHSCQPFNTKVVLDFVRDSFQCREIRSLIVKEMEFEDDYRISPPIRKHPVRV